MNNYILYTININNNVYTVQQLGRSVEKLSFHGRVVAGSNEEKVQ